MTPTFGHLEIWAEKWAHLKAPANKQALPVLLAPSLLLCWDVKLCLRGVFLVAQKH